MILNIVNTREKIFFPQSILHLTKNNETLADYSGARISSWSYTLREGLTTDELAIFKLHTIKILTFFLQDKGILS